MARITQDGKVVFYKHRDIKVRMEQLDGEPTMDGLYHWTYSVGDRKYGGNLKGDYVAAANECDKDIDALLNA